MKKIFRGIALGIAFLSPAIAFGSILDNPNYVVKDVECSIPYCDHILVPNTGFKNTIWSFYYYVDSDQTDESWIRCGDTEIIHIQEGAFGDGDKGKGYLLYNSPFVCNTTTTFRAEGAEPWTLNAWISLTYTTSSPKAFGNDYNKAALLGIAVAAAGIVIYKKKGRIKRVKIGKLWKK